MIRGKIQSLQRFLLTKYMYVNAKHTKNAWNHLECHKNLIVYNCDLTVRTSRVLQVIKMLMAVVSLFAFCWLPLQLYNLLSDINPAINTYVSDVIRHSR